MTERNKRLTRESMAKLEIGHTDVAPRLSWVLIVVFLATVYAVPLAQHIYELGRNPGELPQLYDIFQALASVGRAFSETDGGALDKTLTANARMLQRINEYEDALDEASVLSRTLLGPAQELMIRYMGQGNEQGYAGRDGWLFYRPALDYLTGPGFLDIRQLRKRRFSGNEYTAPPQPDPRLAIVQFHEQLKARGIQLVIVPVPVKASIHPERFSARYQPPASAIVQNLSYEILLRELDREGLLVFDPAPLLAVGAAEGVVQFLESDTHWTPVAVECVARELARFLKERILLASPSEQYQQLPAEAMNLGDIAVMLKLPQQQCAFQKQKVAIRQVVDAKRGLWRPRKDAEVLVLGDSFSNIYSLDEMGWGEGAGFIEQLSFHLNRPLDRIAQNDNGAYATRQTLSRELAKGRDRLAGKKVVVWEFSTRELAIGDWKLFDMKLGVPTPARFVTPEEGQSLVVTGIVEAVSPSPRPGSVPYKDHIVTIHLRDLEHADGSIAGGEALVYMWSMRDNIWTTAARLREGRRITLRLRSWYEVADKYEAINRSELDDQYLQLEDPCWGETLSSK